MVRQVRLGSDDSLSDLDPTLGRPKYDDLDDLVFDTLPEKPRGKGPAHNRRRRSPKPAKNEPRRHLADADWLTMPPQRPNEEDAAA